MDLVDVDEVAVESNIVLFHLKPEAPPVFEVLSYLKDAGIILGGMKGACHATPPPALPSSWRAFQCLKHKRKICYLNHEMRWEMHSREPCSQHYDSWRRLPQRLPHSVHEFTS